MKEGGREQPVQRPCGGRSSMSSGVLMKTSMARGKQASYAENLPFGRFTWEEARKGFDWKEVTWSELPFERLLQLQFENLEEAGGGRNGDGRLLEQPGKRWR